MAQTSWRKLVVVIFGCKESGKDTFGKMLAEAFAKDGWNAEMMSFADPLKQAARHLLGIPLEVLRGSAEVKEDPKHAVYGKTPRKWLQWLGTEIGRDMIDQDLWVHRFGDACLDAFKRPSLAGFTDVVIGTDGRFFNEREKIGPYLCKRRDDVFFWPVALKRPTTFPATEPEHASEREVWRMTGPNCVDMVAAYEASGFAWSVLNDGTMTDLRRKAEWLAADMIELEGRSRVPK